MVVVEKKQLDDRCGYLMLVESWTRAAGRTLMVTGGGRVVDVCGWTNVAGS